MHKISVEFGNVDSVFKDIFSLQKQKHIISISRLEDIPQMKSSGHMSEKQDKKLYDLTREEIWEDKEKNRLSS